MNVALFNGNETAQADAKDAGTVRTEMKKVDDAPKKVIFATKADFYANVVSGH